MRDLEIGADFSGVPEDVMRNAACRGKLVEIYCYRLLQGFPVTIRTKHCGSLQESVAVRVDAFWRWMQVAKPEYVDHHTIVFSTEDGIAWERDFRAIIAGRLTLVDIKCTARPEANWPLLIGCGLSYDEDGATNGGVIHLAPHLNKNGFKWRPYDAKVAKGYWKRAVSHWQSKYDFRHLKAEMGLGAEAMGFETEEAEA